MHARRLVAGMALLALALSASAPAVSTRSGNVDIEADETMVNLETGVREYVGNVHVHHPRWQLRAERLEEHRRGGEIVKVIAEGKPLSFESSDPTAKIRSATASRAEYSAVEGTLRLWDYSISDVSNNRNRGKRGLFRFGAQSL